MELFPAARDTVEVTVAAFDLAKGYMDIDGQHDPLRFLVRHFAQFLFQVVQISRFTRGNLVFLADPFAQIDQLAALRTKGPVRIPFPLDRLSTLGALGFGHNAGYIDYIR